MTAADERGLYLHGAKAQLRPGELLAAGRASNFGQGMTANFVYFTATLDAAVWVSGQPDPLLPHPRSAPGPR